MMSCFPVSWSSVLPLTGRVMKLSCFSAVVPVRGWNQWVLWVAPFSTAQSFISLATMSAVVILIWPPWAITSITSAKTFLGSRSRMTDSLKTLEPKISVIFIQTPFPALC